MKGRSLDYYLGYRAGLQAAINSVFLSWTGYKYRAVAEISGPVKDYVIADLSDQLKRVPDNEKKMKP